MDVGLQAAFRDRRDRVGRLVADHPGHVHLRQAGRDDDRHRVALVGPGAGATGPARRRTSRPPCRPVVRMMCGCRPASRMLPTAFDLLDPLDEGHGDRLRRLQLVLHLRVDVPAARDRCRDQDRGEQPGPERAAADRLVVLVEAGRRAVGRGLRGAGRSADDLGGRGRDRGRRADAAQHVRRRLLGLGRDRLAARRPGEVGIHRLGGLVAVLGPLRQRAQDDRVELVRHLGALLRGRLRASPRGASWRSRAACRR